MWIRRMQTIADAEIHFVLYVCVCVLVLSIDAAWFYFSYLLVRWYVIISVDGTNIVEHLCKNTRLSPF